MTRFIKLFWLFPALALSAIVWTNKTDGIALSSSDIVNKTSETVLFYFSKSYSKNETITPLLDVYLQSPDGTTTLLKSDFDASGAANFPLDSKALFTQNSELKTASDYHLVFSSKDQKFRMASGSFTINVDENAATDTEGEEAKDTQTTNTNSQMSSYGYSNAVNIFFSASPILFMLWL
jgi:hypothetical protein